MSNKTKFKKGDYVEVISGAEVGKRGKILRILTSKDSAIVEGVNFVTRHAKKTQKNPQSSGRYQKEAPINISNLMLFCPHCQKTTRCCYRYEEEKEASSEKTEQQQAKRIKIRCCTCPKHLKI